MLNECVKYFPGSDLTIMAAAVADYTIVSPSDKKIKKSRSALKLELTPSTDILAKLGKMKKKNQLIIGFALESENEVPNAKQKLKSKNLDMIVLNSLKDKDAGFGGKKNKVTVITRNNKIHQGQLKDKTEVARDIFDVIVSDFPERKG
jgi:phosphopantothenoylcysteine decarboxylase/phosphopantothenate--cysteine ligase